MGGGSKKRCLGSGLHWSYPYLGGRITLSTLRADPLRPRRRCSLLTAPTAASRKLQPEWLEACYHGQFSFSKRRNR